jgi:hypothetical protein
LSGARIAAGRTSGSSATTLRNSEAIMRIGVLRGRENSFPDAFIAKVNAMDKG